MDDLLCRYGDVLSDVQDHTHVLLHEIQIMRDKPFRVSPRQIQFPMTDTVKEC